jgi:hypothetical protein
MQPSTRICSKCARELPATTEFFYPSSYKTGSVIRICKRCFIADGGARKKRQTAARREAKRQAAARFQAAHPGCKQCSGCGGIFPASAEHFYHKADRKDGFSSRCKTCTKARQSEWYTQHAAQVRQATKRRRQQDPEKHRQSRRRSYANDPTSFQKRSRRWRTRNKSKDQRRHKRYREANSQTIQARERERNRRTGYNRVRHERRRARLFSVPVSFTRLDWECCLAYWQQACAYCGAQEGLWTKLAMDHFFPLIDPRCEGTVPWNIMPACNGLYGCNTRKQDKDPYKWLTERFGTRRAKQILAKIETYFALMRARRSS